MLTLSCYWDAQGVITHWETFMVTEIKAGFSSGEPPKIAIKRLDSTDHVIVKTNPPWIIKGWWPRVGASSSEYYRAQWRAMQNESNAP